MDTNKLKRIVLFSLILFFGLISLYALYAWFYIASQIPRYSDYWKEQKNRTSEIMYVALGDSAAQGIGASKPENGYVGQLALRISKHEGKSVQIINLSKSGGTTYDVLNDQLPLMQKLNPDIVTLSVGANDINHAISKDEILANLIRIFEQLPSQTLVAEIPYLMSKNNDELPRYINAYLKDVTLKKNMILVPIYEQIHQAHFQWNTYSPDFFHPNDKGYKIWTDAFWEKYRENF